MFCHSYVDPASIYRILPQIRPGPDPSRIYQIHQISGRSGSGSGSSAPLVRFKAHQSTITIVITRNACCDVLHIADLCMDVNGTDKVLGQACLLTEAFECKKLTKGLYMVVH